MQAPTIHPARGAGDRSGRRVPWVKLLGLVCCLGPLALLLAFAFGEGVLDEGWGHLLQAAPLVVLVIVAWWRPLAGGLLITIVATALAVVYAATGLEHDWWLPTVLMFFVPAIVGGLLFAVVGITGKAPRA